MKTFTRAGIYFFYDDDGIVDDYIPYFLNDLQKNLSYLMIICNGKLSRSGRKTLELYADEVIVRENIGLDVWAYKSAFQHMGWDKLSEYDEIVICNSTLMGPVYPFKDVFDEMAQRDIDFWGITKHGSLPFDPFHCNPYGYLPEHIQSHFMAFRKKLIMSQEFQMYWDNMEMINSYSESIGRFETAFTKLFADKGFGWDTYIKPDALDELCEFPLIFYPRQMLETYKCPIFKRRSFFQEYDYILSRTTGQPARELYAYLENSGRYDTNLIWDNILRTCNQEDIVRLMHLNYILSTTAETSNIKKILKTKRVALVMHLYFLDLLPSSYHYASSMPEEADIYITTNTQEKQEKIEKYFSEIRCNKLEVRVIENRGRDVSSILVGVKDVIHQYDYVCFVHDKKAAQIKPASVGESFAYKCLENTLQNRTFVANVLETFEQHPRLGLLSPPIPNHADYYPILGNEWSANYQITKDLAMRLGIKVSITDDKVPVAPYGTCFWFRPKAFHILYDYDWDYSDFPEEPNNTDHTILHAIERIYPYAVQQAGFYPAVLMADTFAAIEHTNLQYYTRQITRTMTKYGLCNYQPKMLADIDQALAQYCGTAENPLIKEDFLQNQEQLGNDIIQRRDAIAASNSSDQKLAEIVRYYEECVIPETAINRKIRRKMKALLPKWMFGSAIKIKRLIFGPHGIEYKYDE